MTFEEFFAKKRIDLELLKRADAAVFASLVKEYAAMGEKSFDHTKKYLFNNWRKKFLLVKQETSQEEEK